MRRTLLRSILFSHRSTGIFIVEVSPAEFEKIKTKELKLPKGWQVGEEIPRPADAPGVS